MKAVDLDVVNQWLDAGEQAVRHEMLKGGSVQRIAILTGSKQIITSLKNDIRGPRFSATPVPRAPEQQPAPNLTFMTMLDGEKLTEYLARVKDEASQRGLPDVVGFVQAMELHQSQGAFDHAPKKYAVPTRTTGMTWGDALKAIVNANAAQKYNAVMEALEYGPFNDDQLRNQLRESGHGMVPGTVTAYRGDLARAGWVRYTGQHIKGESGSSMKVWEIAP